MYSITDLSNINYFEQQHKVTSIFLATGLEKTTIDWLFSSWGNLHRITGHSWHLLVPTFVPINDRQEEIDSKNFNSTLASELMDQYGISSKITPCLVFDDLNEESQQPYLSLADKSESTLKTLMFDCAHIIEKHIANAGCLSPGVWRNQVIGELFNRAQAAKYGRQAMKLLPLIGSISKYVSGAHH